MHAGLLPKAGHIMHAITRDYHEKVAHAGQGMTINEIYNHGYWIINYQLHKCCQVSHIQMYRLQEVVWKNTSTEDGEPPC